MGTPAAHVELIEPDPEGLRRFYGALFGGDAAPGTPVADRVSAPDVYSFVEPEASAAPAAGGDRRR